MKREATFIVFGIPLIVILAISIVSFLCNIRLGWDLSWFVSGGIVFTIGYGIWAFLIYDPLDKRKV